VVIDCDKIKLWVQCVGMNGNLGKGCGFIVPSQSVPLSKVEWEQGKLGKGSTADFPTDAGR